jgi:hypothetical protein
MAVTARVGLTILLGEVVREVEGVRDSGERSRRAVKPGEGAGQRV